MYALETLAALNAAAVANARTRRARADECGWSVQAEAGKVEVLNAHGGLEYVVDVSDPLDDEALVEFHKRFDGPRYVAQEVESYASQWRRIIHTTPAWNECVRRRDARRLAQAA